MNYVAGSFLLTVPTPAQKKTKKHTLHILWHRRRCRGKSAPIFSSARKIKKKGNLLPPKPVPKMTTKISKHVNMSDKGSVETKLDSSKTCYGNCLKNIPDAENVSACNCRRYEKNRDVKS